MREENLLLVEGVLRDHLHRLVKAGEHTLAEIPRTVVTLTYGDIAKATGVGIARNVPPYLNAIAERCRLRGDPSIDCLVVNARTLRPGAKKWSDSVVWKSEIDACLISASRRLEMG